MTMFCDLLKFSKKEKLALIGLVAILVGYGIYQTAYGTNESSYKIGYHYGFDSYACSTNPHSPDKGCDGPDPSQANIVSICSGVGNPAITNSTACIDGYYNGFVHWCSADAKDCAMMVKQGDAPIAIVERMSQIQQ
jgi:hypothetical protein